MSLIICPNCKSALNKEEKTLKCLNGHSFDIAKDGYVNLLLANQKKRLNPGDNKEMMLARETFLTTKHYDFLIEHIDSFIKVCIFKSDKSFEELNLLDLGCGSGYYTRNILSKTRINKIGIDISKPGIRKASKNDKQSSYFISSIFDLPIEEQSINIILNIFSPVSISEVIRVLKPEGYFIKVIPGENHMVEIAKQVYDEFIPHQSSIEEEISSEEKLQLIKVEKLEKKIYLKGEDLQNQIAMTPYYYKFESEVLNQLKELEVTISFKVIVTRSV